MNESFIETRIVSDVSEIQQCFSQCIQLANESKCNLPFQYFSMPNVWWDHFNNNDGTVFSEKRGFNFVGSQCWLQNYKLLIAAKGKTIVGAIPMVSYSVRMLGEKDLISVLTFPGDYLTPYHDFIISPIDRNRNIRALLDSMINSLDDNTIIILPFIPEKSPHVDGIKNYLGELSRNGFNCRTALIGRKGGVRTWTSDSYLSKANKKQNQRFDRKRWFDEIDCQT